MKILPDLALGVETSKTLQHSLVLHMYKYYEIVTQNCTYCENVFKSPENIVHHVKTEY